MFNFIKRLFGFKPKLALSPPESNVEYLDRVALQQGPYRSTGIIKYVQPTVQERDIIKEIELNNKLNLLLDIVRRPDAYGHSRCIGSIRSDILAIVLGEEVLGDPEQPSGFPPRAKEHVPHGRVPYQQREDLYRARWAWVKKRWNNPFHRWS